MIINQIIIWVVLFMCAVLEKSLGSDLFWREALLLVVFWAGIRQGKLDDDTLSRFCSKAFVDFMYNYDEYKEELKNESRT